MKAINEHCQHFLFYGQVKEDIGPLSRLELSRNVLQCFTTGLGWIVGKVKFSRVNFSRLASHLGAQLGHFRYSGDFVVFPVYRHFRYQIDVVVHPVSRHVWNDVGPGSLQASCL